MKSSISSFFRFQTPPPGSQEGLPYWTLWFLLCIILLLLTFIFLRDKDLRQRLNRFLFGAKKKLIRFRLQARLKMAKRKKGELHRELGQKVWDERLDVQGAEKISTTLAKLMESKASLLDELVEAEIKISKLKKSLDEKILKSEIKISGQKTDLKIQKERLSSAKEKANTTRSLVAQNKKETDELKKEINEWERNKVRVQEKIEKIEKRTTSLFENLGILADHTRLEQKTLLLNYSQIDRNKKRITDIEQQLKDLE